MVPSMFAAYLLVLLTATGGEVQENLTVNPSADWELGNTEETRDAFLMEFVKKGEKIDSWTELLTVQQFRRKGRSSPRDFYDSTKETREKRCPGLTEWQILEADKGLFLYEWKTTSTCDGHPPQSEVARLICGRNTGYRVAFTTRASLTPEMRAKWMDWLRSLSLER